MNIKYICEFVHLSETCSFFETANELYVSQSSLSKHIQVIEQELGVQLFNRNTRKVTLNKYGEAFYPFAKQIAELYDDSVNTINYLEKQSKRCLDIGALGLMNFYGLYDTLFHFVDEYPDYKYTVVEGKDIELKRKLDSSDVSFVFTSNIQRYPEYKCLLWKTDELVLIVHESSPLRKYESIQIEQLKNYEIMIHGSPVEYSGFISACKNSGFTPRISSHVSFSATIISLVAGNHGISVINRSMLLDRDLRNISIIPITPTLVSNVYLVYRPDCKLSSIEKDFLTFIENCKTY